MNQEEDIVFKRSCAIMELLIELLKVGTHYDIDPRTLAINVAKFVEMHPEVLLQMPKTH